MTATNKPAFAVSGRTLNAVTTAAKTTYNDSTNGISLVTAGSNGSIITAVHGTPRATCTASMLQLYVSPDAGTTMHLVETVLMAAHTVALTTEIPSTDFVKPTAATPIFIAAGSTLWVGNGVALAGGVVFTASVEDY